MSEKVLRFLFEDALKEGCCRFMQFLWKQEQQGAVCLLWVVNAMKETSPDDLVAKSDWKSIN